MSFQADWYPGVSLDESTTWQSQMYYAAPMCDQYGNPQYTPNYAFPYLVPNSASASFGAAPFDTTTWDAWPGTVSTSGNQAMQPQVGQPAPANCSQDCNPVTEQDDAKKDPEDPIKAFGQRLDQLERSFSRFQEELEQDRASLASEKQTLCTEIESYVVQLQQWASKVQSLVDEAAVRAKAV